MQGEIVKLKGSRFGLELLIAPGTSFPAVKEDIQEKLEAGGKFFRRGTIIHLAPGQLTAEQEAKIYVNTASKASIIRSAYCSILSLSLRAWSVFSTKNI